MEKGNIQYKYNTAKEEDIYSHLILCNNNFIPPLSTYTNIKAYSKKICDKAVIIEAWSANKLVGCIAAYCNDFENKICYITNISILKEYSGKGIASELLRLLMDYAKSKKFQKIVLEVKKKNVAAIRFYEKFNFKNTITTKTDSYFFIYEVIQQHY